MEVERVNRSNQLNYKLPLLELDDFNASDSYYENRNNQEQKTFFFRHFTIFEKSAETLFNVDLSS